MTGVVDNTVIVEAPLDLVWRTANDVAHWPSLFSEYAEAEILATNGDTTVFKLRTHPDEHGVSWSWVSERTTDEATHTVRAHRMDADGPFASMHIFWAFQEVPRGVEMRWRQEFHVHDRLPYDDDQMAEHLNENTRIQMDVVKERLEAAARLGTASGSNPH